MRIIYLTVAGIVLIAMSCEIDSGIDCNSNNTEPEILNTGEPFARAQTMRFYFRNETGEDLLDSMNDNSIRPVFFVNESDDTLFFPDRNQVDIKVDNGKYYWTTMIYGKEGYHDYQFYVKVTDSDIDTISAYFRYSLGADGGNGIYANIEKLYYNETLIRSDENTPCEFAPQNIYITKETGKTIVGFED